MCHVTIAYTLQQVHQESVLEVEHQMMAKERWVCQAFMEAFGVAIEACLPKNWGALLYSLQLLTSDVLLAAILGVLATAHLHAVVDRGPAPVSSIISVSEMPVPQTGTKCWCYSLGQGVPALRQKEEETADINDPSQRVSLL